MTSSAGASSALGASARAASTARRSLPSRPARGAGRGPPGDYARSMIFSVELAIAGGLACLKPRCPPGPFRPPATPADSMLITPGQELSRGYSRAGRETARRDTGLWVPSQTAEDQAREGADAIAKAGRRWIRRRSID